MARTKQTCNKNRKKTVPQLGRVRNKPTKRIKYSQEKLLIKEDALLKGEDEAVTAAKLHLAYLRHKDRKLKSKLTKERKAFIQKQEEDEIHQYELSLEIERRDRLRARAFSSPIPWIGSRYIAPRPEIHNPEE